MATATTSARAPRGTKVLTQAFFSAADEIPEPHRAAVIKAALVAIREEMKVAREKASAAKAKAKSASSVKKTVAKPVKKSRAEGSRKDFDAGAGWHCEKDGPAGRYEEQAEDRRDTGRRCRRGRSESDEESRTESQGHKAGRCRANGRRVNCELYGGAAMLRYSALVHEYTGGCTPISAAGFQLPDDQTMVRFDESQRLDQVSTITAASGDPIFK
jgi:hypothetical protein